MRHSRRICKSASKGAKVEKDKQEAGSEGMLSLRTQDAYTHTTKRKVRTQKRKERSMCAYPVVRVRACALLSILIFTRHHRPLLSNESNAISKSNQDNQQAMHRTRQKALTSHTTQEKARAYLTRKMAKATSASTSRIVSATQFSQPRTPPWRQSLILPCNEQSAGK